MGVLDDVERECSSVPASPEKALAIRLAMAIETAVDSDVTALSRELRQVLADLRQSAPKATDKADELKARRAKRRRA